MDSDEDLQAGNGDDTDSDVEDTGIRDSLVNPSDYDSPSESSMQDDEKAQTSAKLADFFNKSFDEESSGVYQYRLNLHQDLERSMRRSHLQSSRHELCSMHLRPLVGVDIASTSLSQHTLRKLDDLVDRLIQKDTTTRGTEPPELAPDVSYLKWRYKLMFLSQVALGFGAGVWGTKESLEHHMGAQALMTTFTSKYDEMHAGASAWAVSVRQEALVDF